MSEALGPVALACRRLIDPHGVRLRSTSADVSAWLTNPSAPASADVGGLSSARTLAGALAVSPRIEFVVRLLDVLLASWAVVVLSPLLLLIAIMIKLDSEGPILFVQERLGRFRVPFSCLKFRTMSQDAERHTGPVWATTNDPRITRVGKFLRKSRADELPQLLNVICGDMSLVGPRPIRKCFADTLVVQVPNYNTQFLVRPGVTGWAQVSLKYASSYDDQIRKYEYDMAYLRSRSLLLYFSILLRTVKAVISLKGE